MNPEWEVVESSGGYESVDFARMLREMYDAWDGPMDQEAGVHAMRRISPYDEQHRRHTSFALVRRKGTEGLWLDRVRTYVFHPYTMAKDHRTEAETPDVEAVFDGHLELLGVVR